VVHICNPSTQEAKAEALPQLCFEASWDIVRTCLKKLKKKKKKERKKENLKIRI
jgi:hypothetical protein